MKHVGIVVDKEYINALKDHGNCLCKKCYLKPGKEKFDSNFLDIWTTCMACYGTGLAYKEAP